MHLTLSGHHRERQWRNTVLTRLLLATLLVPAYPAVSAAPETERAAQNEANERASSWPTRELRRFLSYPFLDQAYRLLGQGRREEARAHVYRALELDPENVEVRLQSLSLFLELGEAEAAEDVAAGLLADSPGDARAWLYRGLARAQLHRTDDALADLSRAVHEGHLSPTHEPLARNALIDTAIGAGRYELAIATLRERGTGDEFRDALRLGMAQAALGHAEDALASLDAALAKATSADDQLAAQRSYALVALDAGQLDGAERAVELGLKAAPADRGLLQVRASLHERAGRWTQAADEFERSLGGGGAPADWVRLGRLRLSAGQPDRAWEAASRGFAAGPNAAERGELVLVQARAELRLGQQQQALARVADLSALPAASRLEWSGELEQAKLHDQALAALDDVPDDPDVRRRRAALYEYLGQFDEAIAQIAPLAEKGPTSERAAAAYQLGMLHIKAAQPDAARDAFEAAAKLVPQSRTYVLALAEISVRTKQYRDARDILQRVAGVDEDPDLQLRLAEVDLRMGDEASAVATLERLTRTRPEGDQARVEAFTRLGYLAARNGRPAQAAAAFEAAFREGGGANIGLLQATVTELVKANDLDHALALIQVMLAADKNASVISVQ